MKSITYCVLISMMAVLVALESSFGSDGSTHDYPNYLGSPYKDHGSDGADAICAYYHGDDSRAVDFQTLTTTQMEAGRIFPGSVFIYDPIRDRNRDVLRGNRFTYIGRFLVNGDSWTLPKRGERFSLDMLATNEEYHPRKAFSFYSYLVCD